jgi:glycine cleavage system H protein
MIPEGLHYTNDHEWVRVDGDELVLGITHHAQEALGDLTYVELPKVGKAYKAHDPVAVVESHKAASDVYAPLAATVAVVNTALSDAPEQINHDTYGEGWICRFKDWDRKGLKGLLTPDAYRTLIASA